MTKYELCIIFVFHVYLTPMHFQLHFESITIHVGIEQSTFIALYT